MINVSWDDAQQYVAWLSRMTSQEYRLLTEAEWEYAARGATAASQPRTRYSWGDENPVCEEDSKHGAALYDCSQRTTWPVGSFRPNAFHLYDVHGNAFEWVEDCYAPYDQNRANASAVKHDDLSQNATTEDCTLRVLRGGAWFSDARYLRSADRGKGSPTNRVNYVGFRIARTLQ